MKIPVVLKIAVLAIAATVFYTYVGQLVPQKEVLPPEVIEFDPDMTPEEMVETGRGIFEGKGLCSTCHTIGKSGALRFPDLSGISSRAATRVPGQGQLEYITASMYAPDEFIVEGFNPGMPTINRPPIGLTDQEILSVVAYLQTLGGDVTVNMDTVLPVPGREVPPAQVAEAGAPEAESAGTPAVAGVLGKHQCASCHRLDEPGRLKAVSLHDVGGRMTRTEILASMLSDHRDADFFKNATIDELQEIVDLLVAKGAN